MSTIINISQIIISVLLISVILLQQRGSGLSPIFGGGGGGVYRTRRGLEKFIFGATIALSILFFATALLNFFFK